MSGDSRSQRAPSSVFSEFYNCENKWSEISVIDEIELSEIKEEFSVLKNEILLLKNGQPKCFEHSETYDKDYSKYCKEVERVFGLNDRLRERLANILFLPEKVGELNETISKLSSYLENNNWVYDMKYLSMVVEKLTMLKDTLTPEKLQLAAGLQEMSKTLEANDALLESLLEPTHNWVEDGPKNKYCDKCLKRISKKR